MPKPILSMKTRTKGGNNFRRALRNARRAAGVHSVQAGFFADPESVQGQPVTNIAATQEFGAELPKGGVIPERPFMRRANSRIPDKAREILRDRVDPETLRVDEATAAAVGKAMVKEIQTAIDETDKPENAPITRGRKGRDEPLQDTGEMRDAVEFRVIE